MIGIEISYYSGVPPYIRGYMPGLFAEFSKSSKTGYMQGRFFYDNSFAASGGSNEILAHLKLAKMFMALQFKLLDVLECQISFLIGILNDVRRNPNETNSKIGHPNRIYAGAENRIFKQSSKPDICRTGYMEVPHCTMILICVPEN